MQRLTANNSSLLSNLSGSALSCFSAFKARWSSQLLSVAPCDVRLEGDLLRVWPGSVEELPVLLSLAVISVQGGKVAMSAEGVRPVTISFSSKEEAEQWASQVRAAQAMQSESELLASRALRVLRKRAVGTLQEPNALKKCAGDDFDNPALHGEVACLLDFNTQPAVRKSDSPKKTEVVGIELARLLDFDMLSAVGKLDEPKDTKIARHLDFNLQSAVEKSDEPKKTWVAGVENISLELEVARFFEGCIQPVDKSWIVWHLST